MANDPQTQDKNASPLTPPPSAKQAAAPKAPKGAPKQAAAPKAPDLEQLLAEAGDDPAKLRALVLQQQAAQPAAPEAPQDEERPATYQAKRKRYYAMEDFEGSVGAGGLSTAKFRGPLRGQEHGQEIKDEALALEMIKQELPIEVVEEEVELKTTYANPECPTSGRWAARNPAGLVE